MQREPSIDQLNRDARDALMREPREALRISSEALARSREGDYEVGIADSLLTLGWAHAFRCAFEDALSHFGQALSRYRSLTDAEGEMECLGGLGVVHHRLSHLESALEYFNEELRISQDGTSREGEIAATTNIGEVCSSMGRHAEALGYFLSAFSLLPEGEPSSYRPTILTNIGASERKLGRMDAAGENLRHAYDLVREGQNMIARINAASQLGLYLQDQRRYREAEILHREALALSERFESPLSTMEAKQHLGRLFWLKKDIDKALAMYSEALVIGEELGTTIQSYRIYRRLAEVFEQKGHYRKALEYYRRFVHGRRAIIDEDAELKLEHLAVQHAADRAESETRLYRLRNSELRQKSQELEEANRRLALITRMGQEITASLDLEKLMQTVYSHVNQLMDAAILGIAIYRENVGMIDYRFFIEKNQRMTPFEVDVSSETSFGAWSIRTGREVVVNDVSQEYHGFVNSLAGTPGGAASLVYLPLRIRGRIVGLLTVQSYKRFAYSELNVEALRALASFIAIAMDNSLIFEQVQAANEQIRHMAHHDNLTELPNRRLLSEFLAEYLSLARRNSQGFAVLYIDLDSFKPINDEFGHGSGDGVLKEVATRLKTTLRESDTVARVGGDEFVAVIRDVDNPDAIEKTVQKILAAVSEPIFVGEEERHVEASIGISQFPHDGTTTDELIHHADEAMYRAKRQSGSGYAFFAASVTA